MLVFREIHNVGQDREAAIRSSETISGLSAELPFAGRYTKVSSADKASIREFLANGYFCKATLAVEITKVRFGVKSTTARLITLAILMNGQPV